MRELLLVVFCGIFSQVLGHGRLWDPPSRSSAWKRGYSTPANYNDNELFCGGFGRQQRNGGKCGVCGDPWDGARPNEAGGRYATGLITRRYEEGDDIPIDVWVTANHQGWFEFKICPVGNSAVKATQTCFDLNPLELADGSGTRWYLTDTRTGHYIINARLPAGVTCDQCVLQWHWTTANSWGTDPDTGRSCVGCGPQETFRGCADIAIDGRPDTFPTTTPENPETSRTIFVTQPSRPATTTVPETEPPTTTTVTDPQTTTTTTTTVTDPPTTTPTTTTTTVTDPPTTTPTTTTVTDPPTTTTTTEPTTTTPTPRPTSPRPLVRRCHAVGNWAGQPQFDKWCQDNCNHVTPFCPRERCVCRMVPAMANNGQTATPESPSTLYVTKTPPPTLPPTTTVPETDPPTTTTTTTTTVPTTTRPTVRTTRRQTPRPTSPRPLVRRCHAVGDWAGQPQFDTWCQVNCNHVTPWCPRERCVCRMVPA